MARNLLIECNQERQMKHMTFLLLLSLIMSGPVFAKTPPKEQEEGEEEEVALIS